MQLGWDLLSLLTPHLRSPDSHTWRLLSHITEVSGLDSAANLRPPQCSLWDNADTNYLSQPQTFTQPCSTMNASELTSRLFENVAAQNSLLSKKEAFYLACVSAGAVFCCRCVLRRRWCWRCWSKWRWSRPHPCSSSCCSHCRKVCHDERVHNEHNIASDSVVFSL